MADTSANKLSEIIQTSLENIRTMVDANTVIGDPINTESGTTIIPISKISMGFASGGLDLPAKSEEGRKSFGGGGGSGGGDAPGAVDGRKAIPRPRRRSARWLPTPMGTRH